MGIWTKLKERREQNRLDAMGIEDGEVGAGLVSLDLPKSFMRILYEASERSNQHFNRVVDVYDDLTEDYKLLEETKTKAEEEMEVLMGTIRALDEELRFNAETRKGLMSFINPLGEDKEVRMTSNAPNEAKTKPEEEAKPEPHAATN